MISMTHCDPWVSNASISLCEALHVLPEVGDNADDFMAWDQLK